MDNEIQKVSANIEKLTDGVAIIWRKSFSRVKGEDYTYRDTANLWSQKLKIAYLQHSLAVYDMVFNVWDSPLAAYYNGAGVLTMIVDLDGRKKIDMPKITKQ